MNVQEIEQRLKAAVVGSWFPIDSIECMAALCTFGFEPKTAVPVSRIHHIERGPQDTWWAKMQKTSMTGFDFVQCFRGWHRPKELPAEHRMRDVRDYADRHTQLVKSWRSAPAISVQETLRRGTLPHLASTTNTKLAAALTATGFFLESGLPLSKSMEPGAGSREQVTYWFEVSAPQRMRLQEFLEGWARFAEFEQRHPEDPMCYYRAYGENRERLLQLYHESIPQILIPHGNRCLLVTEGLLPKYKRQLERML